MAILVGSTSWTSACREPVDNELFFFGTILIFVSSI